MKSLKVTIIAPEGLHARPAHQFVSQVAKFRSNIQVRNVTTQSGFVNAKSILMVLTLGVIAGHEIEIQASGEDEESAIICLKTLIESNFP